MAENYDRYLGRRWIEDPDNVKVWERVNKIPDSELWRTHERARERLVAFTRKRLKEQWAKRGVSNRDLALADEVLNSETLTIGFARRFAPYKRAYLLIKDIERLDAILTNQQNIRSRSSWPARPIRRTRWARTSSGRSSRSPTASGSDGTWSFSRITTWRSPDTWSRAWTFGSTRPGGRSRPAARAG